MAALMISEPRRALPTSSFFSVCGPVCVSACGCVYSCSESGLPTVHLFVNLLPCNNTLQKSHPNQCIRKKEKNMCLFICCQLQETTRKLLLLCSLLITNISAKLFSFRCGHRCVKRIKSLSG